MQFITITSALTALSRMMGKRELPLGENNDWKDYVQAAFDYAWRYYKWDWSMRTVTVDLVASPYLPADFDIGGYREAVPTTDGYIVEVNAMDYNRLPSGLRNFYLQYDSTVNKYKVLSDSGLTSITFVYQIAPPTLDVQDTNNNDVQVPFPSAMTIGIGASIYAKQGENPNSADVKQEWDIFHKELNRHVGRMTRNVPRNLNLNLQDAAGTYTGDIRY